VLQALFDYTIASARPSSSQQGDGLTPTLHVGAGFDAEQVWLQLEVQLGEAGSPLADEAMLLSGCWWYIAGSCGMVIHAVHAS